MTYDKFTELMTPLTQFFKPAPDEDGIHNYYDLLCHIPEDELSKAVVEICRTRQYPSFPLPGEIQEAHEAISQTMPPISSEELRDKYSCVKCKDTPGWVTYFKRKDGTLTDKEDPAGYFMAAPCGECELGAKVKERIRKKVLDTGERRV